MANQQAAQQAAQTLGSILAHASSARTAEDPSSSFSDSDGLVSFVNLQSSFINNSPQFKTADDLCNRIANYFAGMRSKTFAYLQANPSVVLPGDIVPTTQWDYAVTHFLLNMLNNAGGTGAFKNLQETYSQTQTVVSFSTDIIKLVFDAVAMPENLVNDAVKFMQGVGQTLRIGWDDRQKKYMVSMVGICHEAVPTDATGANYYYLPKVKHYFLSIDSSQQEFTSPCVDVKNITFNFEYSYDVAALTPAMLDPNSADYKAFDGFLRQAAAQDIAQATNSLKAIMGNVASTSSTAQRGGSGDGIDHTQYPTVSAPAVAV